MKNISKSFCAIPFLEPYINTNGEYGVCCIEQQDEQSQQYTVKDPIEKHWNSRQMRSVREKMMSGVLPPQCSICARQENVGKQSMRQRRNLRYFDKEDVDIEHPEVAKLVDSYANGGSTDSFRGILFSTGRLCQLGCISCSSTYSTFLEREYKKLGYDPKFKDKKNPLYHYNFMPQSELDDNLYDTLKLRSSQFQYLQVTGGEPFISKSFFDYLDWLVEQGYAENIVLLITTNGMNLDRKKAEIIKKFKYSIIMFSVDGYRDIDDYLRYPSNWDEKISNFDFLKNTADEIIFASTIYNLNVFSVTDLLEFAEYKDVKIHLNTLEEPNFLHVKNIPTELKKDLTDRLVQHEKLSSIVKSLNLPTNHGHWLETLDVVKDFDRLRGIEFKNKEPTFKTFY